MTYLIEKTFDGLNVAHRISNQYLCDDMRENTNLRARPCENYHGHGASFTVRLRSEKLINDMVLDFNNIKFLKKALNEHYDHRTTIWINDPLYDHLVIDTWNKIVTFAGEDVCDVPLKTADDLYGDEQHYAWIINIPENIRNNPNVPDYLLELLDAFTVLSFNTSSENLACWIFLVVKNRLRQFRELAVNNNDSLMIEILDNCEVDSVSYSETPNSMCTYRE